jgi:hypothetical protein
MIDVSFENLLYFPTLRTRQAELKGLEMLDPTRKQRIVPVLTLGRWPKALDFSKSAEKARDAMAGWPYFLDLTSDARHLADQQRILRNSSGAFEAWRAFAGNYHNAIPVVQITSDARIRDVTRQAQELERTTGKLAFRIREFSSETPLVINALSALDDPRNAIIFIDCQYIRSALSAYVTATVATVNQIRDEFPDSFITVLSTSFPSSTVPYADATQQRGSIEIQERQLHNRVGGSTVVAYGDHGSIHSVIYDDAAIMRWAARVDYPRELDWYFERRPSDQSAAGYVSAAGAVKASDPDIGTRNIWGEDMIIQAAGGQPHAKAPGSWISVRVNIHLSRQIDFSLRLAGQADDDEGDDDDAGEED